MVDHSGEVRESRHAHRVPLPSQALVILKQRHATAIGTWVFTAAKDASLPLSYGTIYTAISRIRNNTGHQDWCTHDLRRTVVTLRSGQGTPRITLEKILKHAECEVIRSYDRHSYDQEKRTALDAWGRRLVRAHSQRGANRDSAFVLREASGLRMAGVSHVYRPPRRSHACTMCRLSVSARTPSPASRSR
jgi:hypothetical protein